MNQLIERLKQGTPPAAAQPEKPATDEVDYGKILEKFFKSPLVDIRTAIELGQTEQVEKMNGKTLPKPTAPAYTPESDTAKFKQLKDAQKKVNKRARARRPVPK